MSDRRPSSSILVFQWLESIGACVCCAPFVGWGGVVGRRACPILGQTIACVSMSLHAHGMDAASLIGSVATEIVHIF